MYFLGYGHVTPLSRTGKIFCICYAIIGIPVTLLLLAGLVERLLIPTIRFLRFLNSRLGHLYQPLVIRLLHLSMMGMNLSEFRIANNLSLFVLGLVLIVFFILIPAAVFATLEPDWDYLDSIYYCFISLTTIGLGDYIPGDSPDQPNRPFYKIATTGMIFNSFSHLIVHCHLFLLRISFYGNYLHDVNFGSFLRHTTAEPGPIHLTIFRSQFGESPFSGLRFRITVRRW